MAGLRLAAWRVACMTVMVVVTGCCTPAEEGPNTITVRAINSSENSNVDPKLYATSQTVVDPNTDLYLAANAIAGLVDPNVGVLQPGQTQATTLDCSQAQFLGTPGAIYTDPNGGAGQGVGGSELLRLGEAPASNPSGMLYYRCGAIITLTFSRTAQGGFQLTINVRYE